MKSLLTRALLVSTALLPALASVADACPNCRETSNQGFEWGIYLMIGGVLTIGGSVVFLITRVVRAADAVHEAENHTL